MFFSSNHQVSGDMFLRFHGEGEQRDRNKVGGGSHQALTRKHSGYQLSFIDSWCW